MKCCVFTATTGETDPLRPPLHVADGVDYFCITDGPEPPAPWRSVKVEPEDDPVRLARRNKILATCADGYDVSLWQDAAYELMVDPRELADRFLWRADAMALVHPDYKNIEEEANAILRTGKAGEEDLARQVTAYRFAGFDKADSVTTTGFLLRRHSESVGIFNGFWWDQLSTCGHNRDQMSVDYSAWETGIDIVYGEGHYRDNPYAKWHKWKPST